MTKKEKINLTNEQISLIVEHLVGTCMSIDDGFNDFGINYDDVSEESFKKIDAEIFECADCGWWYESHENTGHDDDAVCESCTEDRE